jgi:selenide, water dikinase
VITTPHSQARTDKPDSINDIYKSLRLPRHQMCARGGCQSKVAGQKVAEMLERALKSVHPGQSPVNPAAQPEDCAHVTWNDESLLLTTDLNPLVGPRPFDAGRIAAYHALSDVYARGGLPVYALDTLVVNPDLPPVYTDAALAGVVTACDEAGVEIIGGQTIEGPEMMVGMTVVGAPRSGRLLGKVGAKAAELLYLSKPLGIGLLVRAYQLGILGEDELDEALNVATTSNERASLAALEAGVSASTDVTGFGLLGHLSEMLTGGLGAQLRLSSLPVLSSLAGLPHGVGDTPFIRANLDYTTGRIRLTGVTDLSLLTIPLDPQTNGGLLVSASESAAPMLADVGFVAVGEVTCSGEIEVKA